MKNVFDPVTRQEIQERLGSLTPETPRLWGSMSIEAMLNHAGRQLLIALGEIEVPPRGGAMSLPGVRWFAINWMPWPKGVQTAPQLLPTDPDDLDRERQRLLELIERFVAQRDAGFSAHPLFGALPSGLWGKLAYRHLDHHLRQFSS